MKSILITAAIATSASAENREPRLPSEARTTRVSYEPGGRAHAIRQIREPGRAAARFSADPTPISADSAMVFEIHARTEDKIAPRWRCVAIEDVKECLGHGEQAMELSVRALPRASEPGQLLVAEALVAGRFQRRFLEREE